MKRQTFTVICDVCGCEGESTENPYIKGFRNHVDPKICATNIKAKKRNNKNQQKE